MVPFDIVYGSTKDIRSVMQKWVRVWRTEEIMDKGIVISNFWSHADFSVIARSTD